MGGMAGCFSEKIMSASANRRVQGDLNKGLEGKYRGTYCTSVGAAIFVKLS